MAVVYVIVAFVVVLVPSGLGTSTAKEAKEYFSDMVRHRIQFRYTGIEDDTSITLVSLINTVTDIQLKVCAMLHKFTRLIMTVQAFSKKKVEDRKEWLTNWMEDRKRRAQLGLPEVCIASYAVHYDVCCESVHNNSNHMDVFVTVVPVWQKYETGDVQ